MRYFPKYKVTSFFLISKSAQISSQNFTLGFFLKIYAMNGEIFVTLHIE